MKNTIRKTMLAARRALDPDDAAELSSRIVRRIRGTAEYRQAGTVMIYRAVRGEVCLDGLLGDNKTFCWPYITDSGDMTALSPHNSDCWRTGRYNIPEPVPEKSHLIPPDHIDLVICPCTAFDCDLHRLGMGGGYYDRYLTRCVNARFMAAAYGFQRAERLDSETWDVDMDLVVTEKDVYYRR